MESSPGGLSPQQFEEVYEQYGAFIHRKALRFFGDAPTADEVLSEVMVRIWQRGGKLTALDTPGQRARWIYVVTLHICQDLFKTRKRQTSLMARFYWSRDNSVERPAYENRDLLGKLLRTLGDEDFQIAMLYHGLGHDKVEIHKLLQRSRPFIDARLKHIKKALERLSKDRPPPGLPPFPGFVS